MRPRSEEALLDAIIKGRKKDPRVVVGIGDDCAVVKTKTRGLWQLLKTDGIIEGVHFKKKTAPRLIGGKAMRRSLSDFAAMSGVPEFALITLALDRAKTMGWVRELYRGLRGISSKFRVEIVGGETSATRGPAMIAVALSGYVESGRCVFRSGGKAKDDLFVTGTLGGAGQGKHLDFTARIVESRWLTENFRVHAMMDLSDGLGADLPRLARSSGVSFAIDEQALPLARGVTARQAIAEGEDYELLFAIAENERDDLIKAWRKRFPKVRLTRIGRFLPSSRPPPRLAAGYDHFAKRS